MEEREEEKKKKEKNKEKERDKKIKKERKEDKLSYFTPLAPTNRLLRVDYILLFSLIFNI